MVTRNSPLTKPTAEPSVQGILPKWIEPLLMLAPGGIWLLLLLVLPTLLIFELSLVPQIKPGDLVYPSGLDNYFAIFFDVVTLGVVARSVLFSLVTMVGCLVLGFPVAYWLALRVPARWQNLMLVAFILPFFTSSLLRSYAWMGILRRTGVLNTLLTSIGLPALDLLYQPIAVYIGMIYSLLPYMVLVLYASLERLDRRLLEAAADLGANPMQTFWQVTVPQIRPSIVGGALLVFINALGDFVNPELLGGPSSMTAARVVQNKFLGAVPNWGTGSAMSTVLILLVSLAIALLIKYGDHNAKPL